MNTELEEEFRRWNRPVASSVAFLRSFRMEGPTASNPGAPSEQTPSNGTVTAEQFLNHFEGLDLDELPENVRNAITKAKGDVSTLQTNFQTVQQKTAAATEFARKQQARADRAESVLRRHSLDGSAPTHVDPEAAKLESLAAQFQKDGVKPEAALAYAKMFHDSEKRVENALIERLGPLAQTVGNVQADTVLSQARLEHAKQFEIPEVAKHVQDNIAVLVNNGNPVTKATVEHLVHMGYGKYVATHGLPTPKVEAVIPQFGRGGGMGNGGHRSLPNTGDNAPIATQPETSSIIAALNAEMKRDLAIKPSK